MKPSDKLSGMWCLIESCWVKIDFRRFFLYVWTCQLLKLRPPSLSSWCWYMTLQTELVYFDTTALLVLRLLLLYSIDLCLHNWVSVGEQ
jgi:hypothetical protein